MTLRKWTLGMAVAAAALIPLSANAGPTPNLTAGATSGQVDIKFTGVTAEDAGASFGGSCVGTSCQETTFGAGSITNVTDSVNTAFNTWTSGKNGQTIAFYIYGIADQGFVSSGSGVTLFNTGATHGSLNGGADTTTGFNGLIHIDLYEWDVGSAPCFEGAGCVSPSDRSKTTASGSTALPGVTNGTFLADFVFVPGIVPDGTNGTSCPTGDNNSGAGCITLQQNVTGTSDPASGGGSFYLDCVSGPLCSQFGIDNSGNTQDGNITAYTSDQFGKFTVSSLITGKHPTGLNGWQESITDPVEALTVPEPASLGLLGTGLAFFGVAIGRRRRKGISA